VEDGGKVVDKFVGVRQVSIDNPLADARQAAAIPLPAFLRAVEKACRGAGGPLQHVLLVAGPCHAAYPRITLDPPPERSQAKPMSLHTDRAAAAQVAEALAPVLVRKSKKSLDVITVCGASDGSTPRTFARRAVRMLDSAGKQWECITPV